MDVVGPFVSDPVAAGEALDHIATDARTADVPEAIIAGSADTAHYQGTRSVLLSSVDLYQRLLAGQIAELAWATLNGDRFDQLGRWRMAWQRPGAWPDHPNASWSISDPKLPESARVAYDLWKLLGGGIPEWGSLGTGVTVDLTWRSPFRGLT